VVSPDSLPGATEVPAAATRMLESGSNQPFSQAGTGGRQQLADRDERIPGARHGPHQPVQLPHQAGVRLGSAVMSQHDAAGRGLAQDQVDPAHRVAPRDVVRPQRHVVAQAGARGQPHAVDAAPRRPAQHRRLAGQPGQQFMGAFQGAPVEGLVVPGQVVMRPGVVGLFVTGVGGLPHQVGQGLRVPSDLEERRPGAVPPQDREQLRRPLRGRAVVDGERDDPGRRRGTSPTPRTRRARRAWPSGPSAPRPWRPARSRSRPRPRRRRRR
jgi:hypothetical protein